jgi:ADP-heptose:LPS heptosyltransferase
MTFFKNPLRKWETIAPPFKRIVLAKTTQLGDLVISLPMAAALKKRDPHCTVILMTNQKTIDVGRYCSDVDEVVAEPGSTEELLVLLKELKADIFIQLSKSRAMSEAARQAGIPVRIGSAFRVYNWWLCTHLVAVSGTLSGLNKRLLDLRHLLPLGIRVDDLQRVQALYHLAPPALHANTSASIPGQLAQGRKAIILSPSLITAKAHQWPLEFYSRLIRSLDPARFHWFICGVPDDRHDLQALLDRHLGDANVTDMVGALPMAEFISFISACDGLIAGSTGPLHLAAALGIHTLGLFQSRKTDIARWQPVGRSASILHSDVRCLGERRSADGKHAIACPCIVAIEPDSVARRVLGWFDKR